MAAGFLIITFALELFADLKILFFRIQLTSLRYSGLLLFLGLFLLLKSKSISSTLPNTFGIFVGFSWLIWLIHEIHYIFKTQRTEWKIRVYHEKNGLCLIVKIRTVLFDENYYLNIRNTHELTEGGRRGGDHRHYAHPPISACRSAPRRSNPRCRRNNSGFKRRLDALGAAGFRTVCPDGPLALRSSAGAAIRTRHRGATRSRSVAPPRSLRSFVSAISRICSFESGAPLAVHALEPVR